MQFAFSSFKDGHFSYGYLSVNEYVESNVSCCLCYTVHVVCLARSDHDAIITLLCFLKGGIKAYVKFGDTYVCACMWCLALDRHYFGKHFLWYSVHLNVILFGGCVCRAFGSVFHWVRVCMCVLWGLRTCLANRCLCFGLNGHSLMTWLAVTMWTGYNHFWWKHSNA